MPYVKVALPVHAPLEVLWELLIDKIKHPQKYVPGVSQVEIQEKTVHSFWREMTLPIGQIKEEITVNESAKEIIFTLVEHPLFTGEVRNKIFLDSELSDSLELEFTLNWQPINLENDDDEADMLNALLSAVLQTKKLAQEQSPRITP